MTLDEGARRSVRACTQWSTSLIPKPAMPAWCPRDLSSSSRRRARASFAIGMGVERRAPGARRAPACRRPYARRLARRGYRASAPRSSTSTRDVAAKSSSRNFDDADVRRPGHRPRPHHLRGSPPSREGRATMGVGAGRPSRPDVVGQRGAGPRAARPLRGGGGGGGGRPRPSERGAGGRASCWQTRRSPHADGARRGRARVLELPPARRGTRQLSTADAARESAPAAPRGASPPTPPPREGPPTRRRRTRRRPTYAAACLGPTRRRRRRREKVATSS